MLKPKTFATGATGKTGSIVVAELLQAGYPVRALVHHEEGRSAGRKGQGAEIAVAVAAPMDRAPRYAEACRTRGAMPVARLGSHHQSREFEPKE